MKHNRIINAELIHALASLGHKDLFLVVDAGFPIPRGVQRIDLAVTLGNPDLYSVCKAIGLEIVIESLALAEETKTESPRIYDSITSLIGKVPVDFLSHEELKLLSKEAAFIVRTGEATPYANVAMRCGVAF